jgi:hypothetical protein
MIPGVPEFQGRGNTVQYNRSCYAGGSEVLYKVGGLDFMSGVSEILRGKGRVLKMKGMQELYGGWGGGGATGE